MKLKYSPFVLYAYLSVVLMGVVLLTMLLTQVNTPWWLIVILLVLIGLGSLVPVTARLELMQRMLGNLKLGLPFPTIRQRWPDPLYPLLQQVQELNKLDQYVSDLRDGWMTQVAQGAAQEERNRLARELHDSIKQQLFSIQMSAAAVQERWDSDPQGAKTALTDLQQSTHEGLTEMNALLLQLAPAPLERVGLTEAIREQCEALGYRSGATVDCQIGELPADDLLPSGWQESIFRIVQETLSNIARHARASLVSLNMHQEVSAQQLLLVIKDNGKGFQPSATNKGQGLNGIFQRAEALGGQAQIKGAPDEGVSLQVSLPFRPTIVADEQEIQVDNRPNRIAWTSLYRGVLSAAAFLPLVLAQIGIYQGREFASGTWFWIIVPVFMVMFAGWLTGRFIPASNRSARILLSALSGIGVSITTFGLILATPISIQAMDALLNYGLNSASEAQTTILVIDAASGILAWTHAAFWILLPVGAGLGAIGGLIAGTKRISTEIKRRFSYETIIYPLIAGSVCAYLFGTFVLPLMEAAMLKNAMKYEVLTELQILPPYSAVIVLISPLIFMFFSFAYIYRALINQLKIGSVRELNQVHWRSFNQVILSTGLAITSFLLGWVSIEEIPTTTTIFIFGAALLLITNAIFFLRLTIRSKKELSVRMQSRVTWLAYIIPVLGVLLPACIILATFYDVFSSWLLILILVLLLGFSLAYSLLPKSERPTQSLSEIKQTAAELNHNWLATAFSMIIPALPMGSAGLAIISVVIPFVQPLDSERLPGWVGNGDTVTSLLQGDLLIRQPIGFLILLAVGLVLVGLVAFGTHFQILDKQRRR